MSPYQQTRPTNPMKNPKSKGFIKSMVESASPLQLLVLMYDGAIQWLTIAKKEIDKNSEPDIIPNWSEFSNCIKKTLGIISHLQETLNTEHDEAFAMRLFDLYDFINRELGQINMKKDKKKIDSIIEILREVKSSWRQIMKKNS